MLDRIKVLQTVVDHTKAKTYLEIGVESGHTLLRINVRKKIAVDPEVRIRTRKKFKYIFRNVSNIFNTYYRMESDIFFDTKSSELVRRGVDVALIDGLHTYEQSLRDVQNTLKFLNQKGVVVVHDCNPSSAAAAYPASSFDYVARLNLDGWNGQWCGDVWKTICHLRSTHKDLKVFVLDCDCGLGIITKGPSENMLGYSTQEVTNLTYDDLNERRTEILNLKSPDFFEEFIRSI